MGHSMTRPSITLSLGLLAVLTGNVCATDLTGLKQLIEQGGTTEQIVYLAGDTRLTVPEAVELFDARVPVSVLAALLDIDGDGIPVVTEQEGVLELAYSGYRIVATPSAGGSRVVVTGDVTQIDLPSKQLSGLRHVTRVLRNVEGVAFDLFTARDVVRHPLVQRIVESYSSYENVSGDGSSDEPDAPK